jgi:hypothetical protein
MIVWGFGVNDVVCVGGEGDFNIPRVFELYFLIDA